MKNVGWYLALQLIVGYQRYVSPYKGFRCAYAYGTGCASCSQLGFRAIRVRGVLDGTRLLFARFARCRDAHEALVQRAELKSARRPTPFASRRLQQGGFCDALACVPCDAGCLDLSAVGSACDAASCCMGPTPCDVLSCWPWDDPRPKSLRQFQDSRRPGEPEMS
jgi:putative component of membrane protein insertase Oxa1/YidC/SpoIIIJ protein YidD